MSNGVGVWKGSRRDWISRNKQASFALENGSQGHYWTHGWCREGTLMTAFPARLVDDRNVSEG